MTLELLAELLCLQVGRNLEADNYFHALFMIPHLRP